MILVSRFVKNDRLYIFASITVRGREEGEGREGREIRNIESRLVRDDRLLVMISIMLISTFFTMPDRYLFSLVTMFIITICFSLETVQLLPFFAVKRTVHKFFYASIITACIMLIPLTVLLYEFDFNTAGFALITIFTLALHSFIFAMNVHSYLSLLL